MATLANAVFEQLRDLLVQGGHLQQPQPQALPGLKIYGANERRPPASQLLQLANAAGAESQQLVELLSASPQDKAAQPSRSPSPVHKSLGLFGAGVPKSDVPSDVHDADDNIPSKFPAESFEQASYDALVARKKPAAAGKKRPAVAASDDDDDESDDESFVEVAKPVKKKPAMPTTPSIMKRPAGY